MDVQACEDWVKALIMSEPRHPVWAVAAAANRGAGCMDDAVPQRLAPRARSPRQFIQHLANAKRPSGSVAPAFKGGSTGLKDLEWSVQRCHSQSMNSHPGGQSRAKRFGSFDENAVADRGWDSAGRCGGCALRALCGVGS